MDIMTLLPYAVGAALAWAAQKWLGNNSPGGGKMPSPQLPASPPAVDREASDFLAWLLRVKSGLVRLDDHDKESLKLIKSSMADVLPDDTKK